MYGSCFVMAVIELSVGAGIAVLLGALLSITCLVKRSKKDSKYVYYGSSERLPVSYLSPLPSRVINEGSAVFAMGCKSTALLFIGKWTDSDIVFGTRRGVRYALEMYGGAFDKLKTRGYLHKLDMTKFERVPELGFQNKDYISRTSVPILRTEEVQDVFEKIKDLKEIKLMTYDEWIDRLV